MLDTTHNIYNFQDGDFQNKKPWTFECGQNFWATIVKLKIIGNRAGEQCSSKSTWTDLLIFENISTKTVIYVFILAFERKDWLT